MYVPDHFCLDDPAAVAELLRAHGFALLVTAGAEGVQASHIPLLLDGDLAEPGAARLLGHLARANPQVRELERLAAEGGEALAVFQGPHAYVSPRWYAPGPAVPTWNYLAVHVYGPIRPVGEPVALRALMARLIATYEAGAAEPYALDGQDPDFVARMLRGIYAFELPVARLEAKAKLSQNRSPEDRARVAAALEREGAGQATAAWMHRLDAPPGPDAELTAS